MTANATILDEKTLSAAREAAIAAIDAQADALIELSRYIHSNPEIAMQEVKGSKAAADFLEARGFKVERGVAATPTAFRADAVGQSDGPKIGYLAEYDALPNLGHGCGHNLIAIANIGAGIGLQAAITAAQVPGSVTVFGTPAEEAVGGKIIMAEAGLFNDIDAALGAHPGTSEAACPTVEGSGNSLAVLPCRVEFFGEPAHAAADPWNGANALDAVILTFNGMNAMRQHIKSNARYHGIITSGGDAPNIIPKYAAAEIWARASTKTYLLELVEKLRRICEGAAAATGTRLEFTSPEGMNFDMITNHTIARTLKAHGDAVGLEQPEAKAEEGSGSTDWGNVSYVVPSVETSYPILDRVCTWHSEDVVEASISELGFSNTIKVAKAMALTGLDLLADPALLASAKEEFAATLAKRTQQG